MSTIAVIDTGSGNLRSVEKALAKVGGKPQVTSDPDVIRKADRVVVPGQGAFGEWVSALTARGLEESLREVIASGRPYLGICLGLQVLFDTSEEQGPVDGLGLMSGKVVKFRPTEKHLKVPHIGWNAVEMSGNDPLLAGIPSGSYFYFIHSYYVMPTDDSIVALTAEYGQRFAAAVRKDNLFACQFHPEKSQAVGLKLLANFVELS